MPPLWRQEEAFCAVGVVGAACRRCSHQRVGESQTGARALVVSQLGPCGNDPIWARPAAAIERQSNRVAQRGGAMAGFSGMENGRVCRVKGRCLRDFPGVLRGWRAGSLSLRDESTALSRSGRCSLTRNTVCFPVCLFAPALMKASSPMPSLSPQRGVTRRAAPAMVMVVNDKSGSKPAMRGGAG